MSTILRFKRIRPKPLLGRGVTVAYLTFNQAGVGSNPSDPTRSRAAMCVLARSSAVRAASL